MRLKAQQEFTYFLRGVQPVTFAKDEEFETDDQELAEVSQREGWAVSADAAPVAVDPAKPQKTQRRKAATK